MKNADKNLYQLLDTETEEKNYRKKYFAGVYYLTGSSFLFAAGIIFLIGYLPRFEAFLKTELALINFIVLSLVILPLLILASFHLRFRKRSLSWMSVFYFLTCFFLSVLTGFIFKFSNLHYIGFIFLAEAGMFLTNGFIAQQFSVDLSEKLPSRLTYLTGLVVLFLTNYFFYTGLACIFLSFLFVTLIEFYSINRRRLLHVLTIKFPEQLDFKRQVIVGASTITFALLKKIWEPKQTGKIHAKNRWFTNFED